MSRDHEAGTRDRRCAPVDDLTDALAEALLRGDRRQVEVLAADGHLTEADFQRAQEFLTAWKQDTTEVTVPRNLMAFLFDAVVTLDGVASGYLDDEEVGQLRLAARILGVSPDVATPSDRLADFPHAFRPAPEEAGRAFPDLVRAYGHSVLVPIPCGVGAQYHRKCHRLQEDPIHQVDW